MIPLASLSHLQPGALGGFDVRKLGGALLAYLDAEVLSSIAFGTGSNVASWTDLKNGYAFAQATSGAQPVYSATSFNLNRPGIALDGVDDYLENATTPFGVGSARFKVFILSDQRTPGSDNTTTVTFSIGNSNNGGRRFGRNAASGVAQALAVIGTGAASTNIANTNSNFEGRSVASWDSGPVNTISQVGSDTPFSGAAVPATTAARMRIGAGPAGTASQFANIVANCIIIVDPTHPNWTAAAEASVLAMLNARLQTAFTPQYIAQANQRALTQSNNLAARRVAPLVVEGRDYLIPSYGQSLSCGTQSFPAKLLTTTILTRVTGGKMIGDSVYPTSLVDPSFTQIGTLALNPMTATVRGTGDGTLLNAAAQYALAPSAGNLGEGLLEDAVAVMDYFRLRDLNQTSGTARFIGYAAGVGGKTAAELSKGASPSLYTRTTAGATLAKGLASTVSHLAMIYDQGGTDGAVGTLPAPWKTTTRQMRTDWHNDITVAICGASPAAPMVPMFMYQINGRDIGPVTGLAIANAQLEMAQSDGELYLVGGGRGTKKSAHWDVNTTQWNAQRLGYVMYQRMVLGMVPFPFAPYTIETNRNQMLVTFQVPTAPIAFDIAYDATGALNILDAADMQGFNNVNKGLYPSDVVGDLPVTNVAIVGTHSLLITCTRDFGASPRLDYGRRTTPLGAGNVIDSTDVNIFTHEYNPAKGYGPWESVPYYVNSRFPIGFDLCLFTQAGTAI